MNDLLENAARICRDCERVSPSMAVSTVEQLPDICCSIRIQCCRLREDPACLTSVKSRLAC